MSFNSQVKIAVIDDCEKELKNEMMSLNKLKDGPMVNEKFEKKEYIDNLVPANARQMFKFRSKMFNAKFNYKSDKQYSHELWKCSSCQSSIETQEHVLFCPAYATLREGKNIDDDKDLSDYLKKVLLIRENLNLTNCG